MASNLRESSIDELMQDNTLLASGWKFFWRPEDTQQDHPDAVLIRSDNPLKHQIDDLPAGSLKLQVSSLDKALNFGPRVVHVTLTVCDASGAIIDKFSEKLEKKGKKMELPFQLKEDGGSCEMEITTKAALKSIKIYVSLLQETTADENELRSDEWLFQMNSLTAKERQSIEDMMANMKTQGWQSMDEPGLTALNYNFKPCIENMQRESVWKTKAFHAGMIRPFLCLVSFDPFRRFGLGKSLRINLLKDPNFGDAHAEAWTLINGRGGIQSRTMKAFTETLNPFANSSNWYETVWRVGNKCFVDEIFKKKGLDKESQRLLKENKKSYSDSVEACKSTTMNECSKIEEQFVALLLLSFRTQHPEPEKLETLKSVEEKMLTTQHGKEIAERLRKAQIEDLSVIKYGVARTLRYSDDVNNEEAAALSLTMQGETKKRAPKVLAPVVMGSISTALFFSPMIVVPISMLLRNSVLFAFGSTPGKLIPAVIYIVTMRIFLAAGGIDIRDYYPKEK